MSHAAHDATNASQAAVRQHASATASLLRVLAVTTCSVACVALIAAVRTLNPLWRIALAYNGAAFLLLGTAILGALWIARWRVRTPSTPPQETSSPSWYQRWLQRGRELVRTLLHAIGIDTLRAVFTCVLAAIALTAIVRAFDWQLAATTLGRTGFIVGGALLIVAFALLVLERYFANASASVWREATTLTLLTRVVIFVLLTTSLAMFFANELRVWPQRVLALAGLLPAAIAAEIALRALFAAFVRPLPHEAPRLLADSALAGALRWPPRPLRALHDELRERFGIDLRQNWAFAFMRRALLPIAAAVAFVGWSMSGVHEIPLAGRAVYERLGKPVEVWQPGLHFGLPWPLSRVRAVENGVVHELAATVSAEDESELTPAEGPAPESANRLWDASHISENAQVIASASGDRQSFQVVNMDVRFVYRIALHDAAAIAATYQSADVPALIRSTASRVLVRDFATRTLEGVLGKSRTALAADVRRVVQRDLDALGSGVEIVATLIEAVHPPAGAANAYHSVQAAQIKAQATLARERGRTSEQVNEARLQASMAQDKATAAAREALVQAEVAQLKFTAERDAHRKAGKAFLLEQYLSQLSQGLSRAELVILDHRLRAGQAPTIDLRAFGSASDGAALP